MAIEAKLSKEQIREIAALAKAETPSKLEQFAIRTLKISGSTVKELSKAFGVVQGIAGVAGTVIGAYGTAVKLLEMFGILESEDPLESLRSDMERMHQQLLGYYAGRELGEQDEFRALCAGRAASARAVISDMRISRSDTVHENAMKALSDLSDAIQQMTAVSAVEAVGGTVPLRGNIPFMSKSFHIDPIPREVRVPPVPEHWLYYAQPGVMRTTGGRQLNYRAPDSEMQQRIWDPGYYLDTLVDCVAQFVALLTLIEPAFRGTGYKRAELRDVVCGLEIFAKTWRDSLFVTEVDPFFSGPETVDLGLGMSLNVTSVNQQYFGEGIPLGVVDPVSGLAIFDAQWKGPMEIVRRNDDGIVSSDDGPQFTFMISNGEETKRAAKTELRGRREAIEFVCGLRMLDEVVARLRKLTEYGTNVQVSSPSHIVSNSLFSGISNLGKYEDVAHVIAVDDNMDIKNLPPSFPSAVLPPSFNPSAALSDRIDIRGTADDSLAGKTYAFEWKSSSPHFEFYVPIVRRMDATRVQLGYKLNISIGSEVSNQAVLVLSQYHAPISPYANDDLELFPVRKPEPVKLSIEDANLFDVIQSGEYDNENEATFAIGESPEKPIRLLANRHTGYAAIEIRASFEFDHKDLSFPYMGRAHVQLRNLSRNSEKGFIASINLIETAWRSPVWNCTESEESDSGVPEEIPAGAARVCFAPVYKLPEKEFFVDRLKALVIPPEFRKR